MIVAGIVGIISSNDVLADKMIFDENRITIGFEYGHRSFTFLIFRIPNSQL
jgi:hypothetical protein